MITENNLDANTITGTGVGGRITRKDVEALAAYTECPKSKPALEALAGEDYREKVFNKRVSALELLERYPACELPLALFLELSPSMAQRYYSISSSSAFNSVLLQ